MQGSPAPAGGMDTTLLRCLGRLAIAPTAELQAAKACKNQAVA